MKKPFFSVVIPTYNQAKFLNKALDSLKAQKYQNFEVIILDNFSTDETYKVIKKFSKKIIYKKIRNHGVIARSRNKGIKLSKGKWICFLDSDDYWLPNKLEKILEIIKYNKFDVICHSEHIIDQFKAKKKIWNYGPITKNFYKTLIKKGNRFSTSASCIKKSFIIENKIKFDENKSFVTAEDYSFFLYLAFKNAKTFFLNNPLGYRLIHSGSASAKVHLHLKANKSVLRKHVFEVQKFEKNKLRLWKEVNNNFLLRVNLFLNPNKTSIKKRILKVFTLFFEYPKNNFEYFIYLFLKKLKYSI